MEKNISRFINMIKHNRDDGAFVRVSSFSNIEGINEAKELSKIFAEKLANLLPEYWPLEKERKYIDIGQ